MAVVTYNGKRRRPKKGVPPKRKNSGGGGGIIKWVIILGGGYLLYRMYQSGAFSGLFGTATHQQTPQQTQPGNPNVTVQPSGTGSGGTGSGAGTGTGSGSGSGSGSGTTPPAAVITVTDEALKRAATNREWAGEAKDTKMSVDQWNFYRALNHANAADVPAPEDMGYSGQTRFSIITATQYWDALDKYHQTHPQVVLDGLGGVGGWPGGMSDDFGFGNGFHANYVASVGGNGLGAVVNMQTISPTSVMHSRAGQPVTPLPNAPLVKGPKRKGGGAFPNRWKN